MSRTPLLLLAIAVAAACTAQDGVVTGTTLTVDPGTSLRIEGAQTVNVQNGATVVNDGTIVFGTTAAVAEDPNAPINGIGTETTTRSYATPLTAVYPAGLGLELTTAIATGTTTVTRGHLQFIDNGGMQSVQRWFDVDATVNAALDATAVFHYTLTELNGASEANLTWHTRGLGNYWYWSPSTVNIFARTVTTSSLDSLGTITLFDSISTGIIETSMASFSLADHDDGTFTITSADGSTVGPVVVRDALGRELVRLFPVSSCCLIDLRAKAGGAYFVQLGDVHQKLVKR